jgi:hypothetical protein
MDKSEVHNGRVTIAIPSTLRDQFPDGAEVEAEETAAGILVRPSLISYSREDRRRLIARLQAAGGPDGPGDDSETMIRRIKGARTSKPDLSVPLE